MNARFRRALIILSFAMFSVILFVGGYDQYVSDKEKLYKQIDQRLKSAAVATSLILKNDFFENANKSNISREQDINNTKILSKFAKSAGVVYVYAMSKKDDKIVFLTSSATDEELATGENLTSYLDTYKDAPSELFNVFLQKQEVFVNYRDKWGEFRSIFIPYELGGNTFAIGADIRTDEIETLLMEAKITEGTKIIVFFGIGFLFFYWQFSKTNQALKEQNKLLENEQNALFNVFDNGQTVLIKWKITPETKIEYISKSIGKLTGLDADDIKNDTNLFLGCFDDDELSKIFGKIEENSNNKIDSFKQEPYRLKAKNGETKVIIDETYVLRNKNGQIDFYLSFLTDITEEEKKEQLIFEQTKLDAMQEVVGNIAHHWRQPLSAISTIASSIELKLELDIFDEKTLPNDMRQIILATDYLSETIEFFGGFVKSDKSKSNIILQDAIKKVVQFLTYTLESERINLRMNLAPNDLVVYANKSDIEQVLISVIDNAKDALKNHNSKNPQITIDLFGDDHFAHIKISDNGGGIPTDFLTKIFEPYFTTKHQAKGVGLGLHICHEITKNLNGEISASNENDGAVILIKIPVFKSL